MSDHYALLGVPKTATQKDISKAFRARARVVHPDKQPPGASDADRKRATQAFQELSKAHDILSDASRREHYDFTIRTPPPASTRPAPRAEESPAAASSSEPRSRRQQERNGGWEWETKEDKAQRQRLRQEIEERERKEREERRQAQGLGSHWVKPGRPQPGSLPKKKDPATRSDRPPSSQGKATAKAPEKSDDDDSDTSSILSFDIQINLKDLDLDNIKNMDEDDGWGGGEVWFRKPEPDKPDDPAPKAGKKGANGAKQPRCGCTTQ